MQGKHSKTILYGWLEQKTDKREDIVETTFFILKTFPNVDFAF